ncbi:hypothetical protein FVER53590_25820 [Fusarium verticillioides]|nr:hypothetical protein FVER53590_25820 [Fusarium verticillioides]
MAEDTVVIALMGVTGAGKSSLIKTITKKSSIVVGHNLQSQTATIEAHSFLHRGVHYSLVDCPGFNDTSRPDSEILQDIVNWFSSTYGEGTLLSGIIYLHSIDGPRMQGSSLTQFRVFEALCGEDFFHNVIIGTTFWSRVEPDVGAAREAQLFSPQGFFGDVCRLGAQPVRVSQRRDECVALVERFARYERAKMDVQREMARSGGFDATGAARVLETAQGMPHGVRKLLFRVGSKYKDWQHRRRVKRLVKDGSERLASGQEGNRQKLAEEESRHRNHMEQARQAQSRQADEMHGRIEASQRQHQQRERELEGQAGELRHQETLRAQNHREERERKQRELERQRSALAYEQRMIQYNEEVRQYGLQYLKWERERQDALYKYHNRVSKEMWSSESPGMVRLKEPGCREENVLNPLASSHCGMWDPINTSIFEHQDGDWEVMKARDIRPISTIIMDETEKEAVLNDVNEFLNEGARGWYLRRGIPYRKGFLFYGPPGTGNSSFGLPITGHFDLGIYTLSLAGISDSSLTKLFKCLPQRCIILANTSRSRDTLAEDSDQAAVDPAKKPRRGTLSLSGLLNARLTG